MADSSTPYAEADPLYEETPEQVLNRVAKRLGLPHRLGKNADRGEIEQLLCLVCEALASQHPWPGPRSGPDPEL